MAKESADQVTELLLHCCKRRCGRKRTWTDDMLRTAVAEEGSLRKVLGRLGLREAGGNYGHVAERIKQMALSTAHWHGQAYWKGRHDSPSAKKALDAILVKGSSYQRNKLGKRLLDAGLLDRACSHCSLGEWQGHPISLELDHLDGDRTNNELANLRLLCPNCHAMTPASRARRTRASRNPGKEALLEGLARHGSRAALAKEIGVAPDTIRVWLKKG